jgi:hypothetical protein
MALWSWADDFGVGETNLNGLLGFAFPDEDELERKEIQRLCKEVQIAYEVVFYENCGRYFYAIPSWDDHQKTERRANRKNPPPEHPDSRPDLRFGTSEESVGKSAAEVGESSFGTGEQGNIGTGEQGKPRKRGHRLPHDWVPEQPTIDAIKAECPHVDLKAEHRKFVDYWTDKTGKDATKLSWDGTWRNWIRRAAENGPRGQPSGPSVVDTKVSEWMNLANQKPHLKAIGND